ncbi:hypothetical protein AGMMS50276_13330 [Synergistales bacterium]|nr:hypothetical protein AGMMS50276_13330 [Synergistales bacterium]
MAFIGLFVFCGMSEASVGIVADPLPYARWIWDLAVESGSELWNWAWESKSTESVSADAAMPRQLASDWGKLSSTLKDTLELRDKQETLSDAVWFGENKRSNAAKIDALLEKAIGILLQGDAEELRRESIRLRDVEIPAMRGERDELRNKLVSAPESSKMSWVLKIPGASELPGASLVMTRSDIEARIAEIDARIKSKESALTEIRAKIAASLRDMGMKLDDTQIDILLTSVTGEDLFQNTIIFTNVKHVVEKLSELSREDIDNLELTRRYTGMYLVLNDILIATQEGFIEKIDKTYKPQIAAIRASAEKLRSDAARYAVSDVYTESQKKAFSVNAQANAMTVRVANLYAELLDGQKKTVTNGLADLRLNRRVAENTYRTVQSTGDLRALIRSGLNLFDSMQSLLMPQIQPFENDAIRKEFEEINRRLKR